MVVKTVTQHRLDGSNGADVLTGIAQNGPGQIHIWPKAGNDIINLDFSNIDKFSHGQHARGDTDTSNNRGADRFNFQNLHRVDDIIVGRIEDFDLSRDSLSIDNVVISRAALESGSGQVNGYSWRVVEYDADPLDSATDLQRWFLIDTGQGYAFYALEGARVSDTGAANGGTQEVHFIGTGGRPRVTVAELQALKTVEFVDPKNYIPLGYNTQGGVKIHDKDITISDTQVDINGTNGGDLIAAGINDDVVFGKGGNDYIWGGSGDDELNGGSGNDTIDGGIVEDFYLDTSISGSAARVFRIYQGVLDRNPDAGGFNNWTDQLESGSKTLLQVITGFVNSQEYQNRFGNTSNSEFVTLLYNFVLDRSPDSSGFNTWVNKINSGELSREEVVRGFTESPEFKMSSDDEFYCFVSSLRDHNDTLSGGSGADVFVFSERFGKDTILDFDPNVSGEKIDLSDVSSIANYGDLVDNHMCETGSDVTISDAEGNSIILSGVSLSSLTADDFIF